MEIAPSDVGNGRNSELRRDQAMPPSMTDTAVVKISNVTIIPVLMAEYEAGMML